MYWVPRKTILKIIPTCIVVFAISGCVDLTSDEYHQVGKFIDSPVVGLDYETDTLTGRTNIGGEFRYEEGESITFSIGDIKLGPTVARNIVTPLNIAGTNNTNDIEVVNILRLLQTLDDDNDPSNGIEITQAIHLAAKNISLNFNSDSFESDPTTQEFLKLALNNENQLISSEQAISHFQSSLSQTEESPTFDFSASRVSNQTFFLVDADKTSESRIGTQLDSLYLYQNDVSYFKDGELITGSYEIENGFLHISISGVDTFIAIVREENNHLVTCWSDTPLGSLLCDSEEEFTFMFFNSDSASLFIDSDQNQDSGSDSDNSDQPATEEPTPETQPEPTPQPEVQPQPTPQPEPEAQPQPTPQPEPEAQPQPTPQPEPEVQPQPTPQPEPEAQPEPDTGAAGSGNESTKFHPGNYVFIDISRRYNKNERAKRRIAFIKNHINDPELKGFIATMDWRYLEPTKDNYDFKNIQDILQLLKGTGKHLGIYLKERTFNSSCTTPPVPDYLKSSQYGGIYKYAGYICMIKLYRPDVMGRQIALFQALGKAFDNHPNFELVSTGESSIGGDSGYSPDGWTKQLIRLFNESKKELKHTIIDMQLNFIGGGTTYIEKIAAAMANTGGGALGLPDTVPCRRMDIPDSEVCGYRISTYDVLRKYRGKLAIAPDVETWDLIYEQTPEVYDMAVDYLGATHILWQSEFSSRRDVRGYVANYLENQVLPTISSQGGRMNTLCPSALAPCTTN